jgi:hypothetical protein
VGTASTTPTTSRSTPCSSTRVNQIENEDPQLRSLSSHIRPIFGGCYGDPYFRAPAGRTFTSTSGGHTRLGSKDTEGGQGQGGPAQHGDSSRLPGPGISEAGHQGDDPRSPAGSRGRRERRHRRAISRGRRLPSHRSFALRGGRRAPCRPSRAVGAGNRLPMPVHDDGLHSGNGELVRLSTAGAVGGDQPTAALTNDHVLSLPAESGDRLARAECGTVSITGMAVSAITASRKRRWMLTRTVLYLPAGTRSSWGNRLRSRRPGGRLRHSAPPSVVTPSYSAVWAGPVVSYSTMSSPVGVASCRRSRRPVEPAGWASSRRPVPTIVGATTSRTVSTRPADSRALPSRALPWIWSSRPWHRHPGAGPPQRRLPHRLGICRGRQALRHHARHRCPAAAVLVVADPRRPSMTPAIREHGGFPQVMYRGSPAGRDRRPGSWSPVGRSPTAVRPACTNPGEQVAARPRARQAGMPLAGGGTCRSAAAIVGKSSSSWVAGFVRLK